MTEAAAQTTSRGEQGDSSPRCAWCGAPACPTGARLATCSCCGAATTYPPPDEVELGAAYADWYRPSSGRFSSAGDRGLRRSRATLARHA
ncbi:MAG: hypothetical protein M3071_06200, partial [Actinomycetota bacterium]|nr:hypothetical protein [Actinomycetota bacterium]